MALALDIVKGGFSPQSAKCIQGQVAPTVSAAGTVITDATDLAASMNVITTVASGTGVQLPIAEIGDEVEVINLGANTLKVYPDQSTAQINALTAGVSMNLATNTAVKLKKVTTSRWMAFLSA